MKPLGFYNPRTAAVVRNTAKRNKMRDRHFDRFVGPLIEQAYDEGVVYFGQLADWLNSRPVRTWKNEVWTRSRIKEAFRRQRIRLALKYPVGLPTCPVCGRIDRVGCETQATWCYPDFRIKGTTKPRVYKARPMPPPRQMLIAQEEEWRRVDALKIGISSRGRVRRRRLLEPKVGLDGHLYVEVDGFRYFVAYLVTTIFHGPRVGAETIHFIDGDYGNACAANLGWGKARRKRLALPAPRPVSDIDQTLKLGSS
jgi:hypothetical protein